MKDKKMSRLKLNDLGVIHHIVLIGSVVTLAVVGAFTLVLKANHTNKAANATAKISAEHKSSLASNSAQASKANTQAQSNTVTPSSTNSTSSKTNSTSSQTKSTPVNSSPSTPAASPAPSQTPLQALTAIISDLNNGISAQVTASTVSVPGPISTAQARPIVFSVNGHTYFAYTQGNPPNFSTSASQTANSMAIVSGSNVSLTSAYIDKSGNLTDSYFQLVGYSTGGN